MAVPVQLEGKQSTRWMPHGASAQELTDQDYIISTAIYPFQGSLLWVHLNTDYLQPAGNSLLSQADRSCRLGERRNQALLPSGVR